MCGNRALLILPKTEQVGGWLKSHKHHKSTESMVSGGDPKRELVASWEAIMSCQGPSAW
jgi:hypothetical protein